jgi:hypothetical protein
MCRLVFFALIALVTSVVLVHGSTTCNIHQLRRFSNNSLCNKRIYRLLSTFLSSNWSVSETEAQLYCTEECAGNFINFLHNQWDCQKEFKELYVRILTGLCSRNERGKRCIHMLRPSADDLWNNSNTSSLCLEEHHSHLQGLVGKYGCCFKLSFAARINSEPEQFCDIQVPPLCTPDYDVVPVVAGLNPKDQVIDGSLDNSSSSSRTTCTSPCSLFVLLIIFCICCCIMM